MTLEQLHKRVMERIPTLDMNTLIDAHLQHISAGSMRDVLNDDALYYRYLTCLMLELGPKQVVELGGAMGTSALMMLAGLPESSKLYSITLPEHGLEFSFIKKDYPQLIKVIGDDRDLDIWPKSLDLSKTDIMFIDTLHTEDQLRTEVLLYFPDLPKGCLILFDDLMMGGMMDIWTNLKHEKLYTPELHHSGFGILKIT